MNTKTKAKPITGTVLAGYRMYNVPELASLLRITPISVRRYIHNGKLRGQRIGRSLFVSEEALKQFLGVN